MLKNDPNILSTLPAAPKQTDYRNVSISSEDVKANPNKPLEEVAQTKETFKQLNQPHQLPSQKNMLEAEQTWKGVVKDTRNHNHDVIGKQNIRKTLIERIQNHYLQLSLEDAERILDYTLEYIQRHSVITVAFSENILENNTLDYIRVLTTFETGTTGNRKQNDEDKTKRIQAENELFSNISAEHEIQLQNNELARPRYGKLQLIDSSLRSSVPKPATQYGGSFLVLDNGVKAISTFTPGDSLNTYSTGKGLIPSTADTFELLLHQLNDRQLIDTLEWAINGKEAPDINDYIEAQLPAIDVSNSDHVRNILIRDSRTISKEIKKMFGDRNINVENHSGNLKQKREAFKEAIKNKNSNVSDIKKMLKENPWLINTTFEPNQTVLDVAAQRGNTDVFRHLSHTLTGVNVNTARAEDMSVLNQDTFAKAYYHAAAQGNKEVMAVLDSNPALVKGKMINSATFLKDFQSKHSSKNPIEEAIAEGNAPILQILLEKEEDLTPDMKGNNTLRSAVLSGSTVTVLMLLEQKDINKEGLRDKKLLLDALKNGNAEMTKLLLINGADVSPENRKEFENATKNPECKAALKAYCDLEKEAMKKIKTMLKDMNTGTDFNEALREHCSSIITPDHFKSDQLEKARDLSKVELGFFERIKGFFVGEDKVKLNKLTDELMKDLKGTEEFKILQGARAERVFFPKKSFTEKIQEERNNVDRSDQKRR